MDFFDDLSRWRRRSVGPIKSPAVALLLLLAAPAPAEASGIVFVDLDQSGVREAGEPPAPGVAVSNGLDVVRTDAEGRYVLATAASSSSPVRPASTASSGIGVTRVTTSSVSVALT